MTNIFSPQEILRIAVKVEEKGKKLYEILEKKSSDKKVTNLWKYLKEQEEIHRKTFQDMLDGIGDYVVAEVTPGEYGAYIKAIASGYIFTVELMEKKINESFASDLEAVEFGLYIEKESILTYSALREYITLEKQPVLDKVIVEEKEHLIKLMLLRGEIKKR
ncbi:MAG: ferritin family protein [Candidatus Omnitrophota bacterium]